MGEPRQESDEAIVDTKLLFGVKIAWQVRQPEEREDGQVGKRSGSESVSMLSHLE